jgi:cytochrome c556
LLELLRRKLSLIPSEIADYRTAPTWFHEGQRRLWQSQAIDTVACAGTQGGKTACEAPWLLREIQRCAPLIRMLHEETGTTAKFIYAGPTLELLKAQAIPSFKELFQEQERLGTLIEGNKPVFRFSKAGLKNLLGFDACPVTVHFAYTKDSSNLESMTALAGVWDEAGQKENKRESYGAYNRRLKVARSTSFDAVLKYAPQWWIERFYDAETGDATFGRRLWGTTPYEWNWFKSEVYERAQSGHDGFALYNWPSWMSPRVSEDECRRELSRIPLWQWEMMYLGLFTKPAGVIYDTFDYDIDTCEPFAVPPHWLIWPGVDFGDINLCGVLLTEDPDSKCLYLIREYLEGSRTYPEWVAGVKGGYRVRVGAGGSHQEGGWREAFRANGLPLDEPPINAVAVGIASVYEQIKTHNLIVFRSCRNTIDQIQSYSRPVGPDGLPMEGIDKKSLGHYVDALRYIVSKLRPHRRKGKFA